MYFIHNAGIVPVKIELVKISNIDSLLLIPVN